MKEQTRNTEVQINEEIGKLPEKEFRITIVKMIKNLEREEEPRWQRSRMRRTLSPPQIHQKSI